MQGTKSKAKNKFRKKQETYATVRVGLHKSYWIDRTLHLHNWYHEQPSTIVL